MDVAVQCGQGLHGQQLIFASLNGAYAYNVALGQVVAAANVYAVVFAGRDKGCIDALVYDVYFGRVDAVVVYQVIACAAADGDDARGVDGAVAIFVVVDGAVHGFVVFGTAPPYQVVYSHHRGQ